MSGKTSESVGDGVPVDTVFELLSHRFRRELIRCLQEHDEPLTLADAADEIAVATHDVDSLAKIDPETVKQIYMSLYHTHIPHLAEHDVVKYEQELDRIQPADHVAKLNPILELANNSQCLTNQDC